VTVQLLPPNAKREARLRRAMMNTTLAPLPIDRPCPVRAVPAVVGDRRPYAPIGDLCPHCNARLVLGCDHFRPSGDGA
jgi:hypothetical protein